jgi:hypothetical protein
MEFKKPISFLTTFLFFLFVPVLVFSQMNQENEIVSAIRYFDNGEYKKAEPLFQKLLNEKPEHIMLNYYYGACRTENGHYSVADLNHLQKALDEKTPTKVNYYLGIQYHAREQWVQALKLYNKFKLKASIGEQAKVDLAKKIQQCYAQNNPFADFVAETRIPQDTISTPTQSANLTLSNDSLQADTVTAIQQELSEPLEEVSQQAYADIPGESIEFQINREITYYNTKNFKTEKGREIFEKASSKQKELDFSLERVDELREKYAETAERNKKNEIGNKILSFEQESYKLKNEVVELMLQAKNLEKEYWEKAGDSELESFLTNQKKQISESHSGENSRENKQDTAGTINTDYLLINEEDTHLPQQQADQEVIYKIQIGAFSRGLPSYINRLYKKLSIIRKIENYTDENGVVVYTTGNLTNFEDAQVMQKQVQQEGVKDAFIVPYFNGKRITLERAKEITQK